MNKRYQDIAILLAFMLICFLGHLSVMASLLVIAVLFLLGYIENKRSAYIAFIRSGRWVPNNEGWLFNRIDLMDVYDGISTIITIPLIILFVYVFIKTLIGLIHIIFG